MIRKVKHELEKKGLCDFEIESIIDMIKDSIKENDIEDLGYILENYGIYL